MQSEQATKLKEELAAPLRVMQEIARRIAKVSKESKLPINEDDYVKSFKVELMDAVVQWCRGASFADICKVRPQALLSVVPVGSDTTLRYSSRTNLKGRSSVCFGGCRSLSDKCPKRRRSLGTTNCKRNSRRRARCSSGQTPSSSARPCTYRSYGSLSPCLITYRSSHGLVEFRLILYSVTCGLVYHSPACAHWHSFVVYVCQPCTYYKVPPNKLPHA